METPKPKCPACGAEKWITGAVAKTEPISTGHWVGGPKEIRIHIAETGRKFWESVVGAQSPMEARVCWNCGYVSFFATDLAALRDADAKINK